MSADNTIIIARFPDGQYRVAEGGAAENLDDPLYADLYRVMWFQDTPAFADIHAAETKAEEIEAHCGYVEYGICYRDFDRALLPMLAKEAEAKLKEAWSLRQNAAGLSNVVKIEIDEPAEGLMARLHMHNALVEACERKGARIERRRIRRELLALRRKWHARVEAGEGNALEGAARAVQALDEALAATRAPRRRRGA